MIIGTLNVQNIKGNSVYIKEIMKEIDILLIQEHWMFKFEEREIGNILPDQDFYARYVDEAAPISHKERIRGYGGVATIWQKNISSHIKPLPEGNNHIAIVELEAKPKPLCIINVYMPCRGGKHTSAEYRDSLDVIRETITKYSSTHTILLGGDLNASLHRPNPNTLDILLREFCSELSIITPEDYPEEPTLFHHDNKNTSQIDYLLKLQDQSDDGIQMVSIRGQQSTNTSDHVLTTGKIYLVPHKKVKNKLSTTTVYHKPKWSKCDDTRYQSSIDEYLNLVPKCQNENTNIQLILDIVHLSNTLHTAAETAIPKHKANGKRIQRRKGQTPWNEDIGQASRIAKKAYYDWVMAGSPKGQNCMLHNTMKATKKTLRQKQRQAQARIREKKYSDIMESADLNQKLFFKLVREQRTTHCTETDTLYLDGRELHGDVQILEGWNTHFSRLGTPDASQENEIECTLMEAILKDSVKRRKIPDITQIQVENAISKLANNKAPDHLGLTAEHFKKGGAAIVKYTTAILNTIKRECNIPEILKTGLVTPVLKKEKDSKNPGNYRGIAVTPVLGKILETILKNHIEPTISKIQNPMQRGFTEKTSPVNAAILITEGINEAKDKGQIVAITTLDAEKAFDKLDHEILFQKLYHYGITDDSWVLMKMLQTEATTRVKWKGGLSNGFVAQQDIRQGAKLSPTLYKAYNNQLLDILRVNKIGASIGTTFIGCPTVADDIALISHNPSDLQQALHIVHNETKRDKVTINSSKSDVIIINSHKNRPTQTWTLGDKEIAEVEATKHVGLIRSSNGKNDIQSRIQLGRRTMYALLGAGLHGKNGINPKVAYKIYTTFCRPRITYGLEAVILTKIEEQELLLYERKLLKQLQGLSERTPTIAVYSLLGATPITVCIEKNTLTAFYKIIKNRDSAEYEVARRQIAIKDQNSSSWFTHVRKLLQKYQLPTAYELMETPPSAGIWKTMINKAIEKHQITQWQCEVTDKPTLKHLALQPKATKQAHQLWDSVPNNTRAVAKASIKAKLLTGTYILQSNRAKFNQYTVSPTCLLCNAASEDREHLILHCSAHQAIRDKHLDVLHQLLVQHYNPQTANEIMCNSTNLLQCLLDSTKTEIMDILGKNCAIIKDIEEISRNLLYDIHYSRAVNISQI